MPKYIILSVLLLAISAEAQPTTSAPVASISVTSDAKDLAEGYAKAASRLSRPPITLALQKEGVARIIEDVQSIKASEGVLVIEAGKGLIYLINPRDVVYITDGSKLTPKN